MFWHVKDKAQLLDLLAEAVCEDAFEIDGTASPPSRTPKSSSTVSPRG
ncbi:hypothetical protein [Amycolatopsis sp. cmx-4-83]